MKAIFDFNARTCGKARREARPRKLFVNGTRVHSLNAVGPTGTERLTSGHRLPETFPGVCPLNETSCRLVNWLVTYPTTSYELRKIPLG